MTNIIHLSLSNIRKLLGVKVYAEDNTKCICTLSNSQTLSIVGGQGDDDGSAAVNHIGDDNVYSSSKDVPYSGTTVEEFDPEK